MDTRAAGVPVSADIGTTRRAAELVLAATLDTDPDTPSAGLLDRAAALRAALADLVASAAELDERAEVARAYLLGAWPRFDLLLPPRLLTTMFYDLRKVTAGLLEVIGLPVGPPSAEPVSPSVHACHGARWAIRRVDSAWVAERTSGAEIRVVAAHSEAELIAKLDAVEAEEGSQPAS
jgi:hypothetical protein